jgi:hypothetical protein
MTILGRMLKFGVLVLLVSTTFYAAAAEFNKSPFLNARGDGKIRQALARSYMQAGAGATSVQQSRSVVNIGNRRDGNCEVNIAVGGKDTKEIVSTVQEVINYCK